MECRAAVGHVYTVSLCCCSRARVIKGAAIHSDYQCVLSVSYTAQQHSSMATSVRLLHAVLLSGSRGAGAWINDFWESGLA